MPDEKKHEITYQLVPVPTTVTVEADSHEDAWERRHELVAEQMIEETKRCLQEMTRRPPHSADRLRRMASEALAGLHGWAHPPAAQSGEQSHDGLRFHARRIARHERTSATSLAVKREDGGFDIWELCPESWNGSVPLMRVTDHEHELASEREKRERIVKAVHRHRDDLDARSLGNPEQVKRDRDQIDNALYNVVASLDAGEPEPTIQIDPNSSKGLDDAAPSPVGEPCEHCPDGHRKPGSKPMAVWVGPERDIDGQPTTLHVGYTNGHHVGETEAEWLRGLLSPPAVEVEHDERPEREQAAFDQGYAAAMESDRVKAAFATAGHSRIFGALSRPVDREARIRLVDEEIGDWAATRSLDLGLNPELGRDLATAVVDALAGAVPSVGEASDEDAAEMIESAALYLRTALAMIEERDLFLHGGGIGNPQDVRESPWWVGAKKFVSALKGYRMDAQPKVEDGSWLNGEAMAVVGDALSGVRRERDEERAEIERLQADLAEQIQKGYDARNELGRLRAAKPLTTELLRNPPEELVEAQLLAEGAHFPHDRSPEPERTQNTTRAGLAAAADYLDAHHSPPSLDERGDRRRDWEAEIVASLKPSPASWDRNGAPVDWHSTVAYVLHHAELVGYRPSPAAGLTVEDDPIRNALIGPEPMLPRWTALAAADDVFGMLLDRATEDDDPASIEFVRRELADMHGDLRAALRPAAVSEGPDTNASSFTVKLASDETKLLGHLCDSLPSTPAEHGDAVGLTLPATNAALSNLGAIGAAKRLGNGTWRATAEGAALWAKRREGPVTDDGEDRNGDD